MLLVLRGLQGFALAGLPAVAVAYLREELDAAVSARAIGLFVSGNAIGGLTGRLLGGLLVDLGGWRTALGGIAALAVGCTVAVRLLLPPPAAVRPRRAADRVRCCGSSPRRSPIRCCSGSTAARRC